MPQHEVSARPVFVPPDEQRPWTKKAPPSAGAERGPTPTYRPVQTIRKYRRVGLRIQPAYGVGRFASDVAVPYALPCESYDVLPDLSQLDSALDGDLGELDRGACAANAFGPDVNHGTSRADR